MKGNSNGTQQSHRPCNHRSPEVALIAEMTAHKGTIIAVGVDLLHHRAHPHLLDRRRQLQPTRIVPQRKVSVMTVGFNFMVMVGPSLDREVFTASSRGI
jgi:hypothetical protein